MDSVATGQGGRSKNITVGSLMNLSYTYDKSGNASTSSARRLRKINSTATVIETQNFTYDALDRLITANATGGPANYSETYAYNATTGNLTTKGSLTLQYNDSAHAHAVTNAGSNTYSYDSNGNQTTRVIGGQSYTLSYNAENQLVSVTGPSMTASFVGVYPERSRRDGGGARDEFFAMEMYHAVAALARADVNFNLIGKHGADYIVITPKKLLFGFAENFTALDITARMFAIGEN